MGPGLGSIFGPKLDFQGSGPYTPSVWGFSSLSTLRNAHSTARLHPPHKGPKVAKMGQILAKSEKKYTTKLPVLEEPPRPITFSHTRALVTLEWVFACQFCLLTDYSGPLSHAIMPETKNRPYLGPYGPYSNSRGTFLGG